MHIDFLGLIDRAIYQTYVSMCLCGENVSSKARRRHVEGMSKEYDFFIMN
jgi:hypothetical protein